MVRREYLLSTVRVERGFATQQSDDLRQRSVIRQGCRDSFCCVMMMKMFVMMHSLIAMYTNNLPVYNLGDRPDIPLQISPTVRVRTLTLETNQAQIRKDDRSCFVL